MFLVCFRADTPRLWPATRRTVGGAAACCGRPAKSHADCVWWRIPSGGSGRVEFSGSFAGGCRAGRCTRRRRTRRCRSMAPTPAARMRWTRRGRGGGSSVQSGGRCDCGSNVVLSDGTVFCVFQHEPTPSGFSGASAGTQSRRTASGRNARSSKRKRSSKRSLAATSATSDAAVGTVDGRRRRRRRHQAEPATRRRLGDGFFARRALPRGGLRGTWKTHETQYGGFTKGNRKREKQGVRLLREGREEGGGGGAGAGAGAGA